MEERAHVVFDAHGVFHMRVVAKVGPRLQLGAGNLARHTPSIRKSTTMGSAATGAESARLPPRGS